MNEPYSAASAAISAAPSEPYGLRQRRWDAMRDEQKQEVVVEARRGYRYVILPSLLVYSLLPSLAAFYLVREFATPKPESESAPVRAGSA